MRTYYERRNDFDWRIVLHPPTQQRYHYQSHRHRRPYLISSEFIYYSTDIRSVDPSIGRAEGNAK